VARRKITENAEGDSGIALRLKHLRDERFGGNSSRMARELGISHPVISRVLSGDQPPPGKLLEAAAKVPGLNIRWLLAGEGESFTDRGLGDGGGHFCPIARALLPGDPKSHPELMTQTSLAVATAFYAPSAYWFVVPKGHPIIKGSGNKVSVGDYLLIETVAQWTRRQTAFEKRLCVFTLDGQSEPILARVGSEDYFAVGEIKDVVPFWLPSSVDMPSNAEMQLFVDRPASEDRPLTGVSDPYRLYRNDLVGVCRMLCRLDM